MSEETDVELRNNVEMTPLDDIYPYADNPKNHPPEQIKKIANSIQATGAFDQPIVVDADGEIIKGHGRFQAAARLGLDKVPVIWASDMDDEQIKTARIADNKTNMETGFDFDTLGDELEELNTDYELETEAIGESTGLETDMVDDLAGDTPDADELFEYDNEDDGIEEAETDDTEVDTDDSSDETTETPDETEESDEEPTASADEDSSDDTDESSDETDSVDGDPDESDDDDAGASDESVRSGPPVMCPDCGTEFQP